jgi:dynactin complex subunit
MADLKRAVEQREALKARNKELEAAAAELKALKEAQMTEAQKSAARVAELEPLAQRTSALEASVNALLEQELTTVPEELRDMVPPLDVVVTPPPARA